MSSKKKWGWSRCDTCQNWAYDYKIKANGGRCRKCDSEIILWVDKQQESEKPPWAKATYAEVVCKQLATALAKLGPDPALQAQLGELQTSIEKKTAPKEQVLPKSAALRQAIGKVNAAKAKMEGIAKKHVEAESTVKKLQEQMEQAAAEVLEAQRLHSQTLAEYTAQAESDGTYQKSEQVFSYDASLFEEDDDLEQEQKDQLAQFRKDAEALENLVKAAKSKEHELVAMLDQARRIKAEHAEKKRKVEVGGQPAPQPVPQAAPRQADAGPQAAAPPAEPDPKSEKEKAEAIAKIVTENKAKAKAAAEVAASARPKPPGGSQSSSAGAASAEQHL